MMAPDHGGAVRAAVDALATALLAAVKAGPIRRCLAALDRLLGRPQ